MARATTICTSCKFQKLFNDRGDIISKLVHTTSFPRNQKQQCSVEIACISCKIYDLRTLARKFSNIDFFLKFQLPGRHLRPHKRYLLPLQKAKRPPTVHQHKVQPPINRRISDNSSSEDAFNKAKPAYDSALKASGYTETLTYNKDKQRNQELHWTDRRDI